ncbi:MAG: cryptochrome/photolyase family protein [Acidimicrobiia bacterium]
MAARPRTVLWFRRDLRLSDHPALLAAVHAAGADGEVLGLFCLDERLWGPSGTNRRWFLAGCLQALDEAMGGRLVVRRGDPVDVVPAVAAEVGAGEVFVTEDFGPYGSERDAAVAAALAGAGRSLERVGSPYAVPPGEVRTGVGRPYQVFTPFSKAWVAHGWPPPQPAPRAVRWAEVDGDGPVEAPAVAAELPEPGEAAAKAAARRFWDQHLEGYEEQRDRPDLDATSRLSPYLKWGCIHPRQLLARLGATRAEQRFRAELCWREFYADVLHHRPESARRALDPTMASMAVDGRGTAPRFRAWAEGRTGYPIVDAGMRQLLAEGWVHNRVRMLAASFLVKDLHLDWTRGARHFMTHLVDGDLASNQHGWQWVAGTGTDASPWFRVFNPVTQGERFDPDGAYVRRWVPELAELPARWIHHPWDAPGGGPEGYPAPMVDHAEERLEALRRYADVRAARP